VVRAQFRIGWPSEETGWGRVGGAWGGIPPVLIVINYI